MPVKVAIFANSDWYLFNFRKGFALALADMGFEVLLLSPPGPYAARLEALGLRWETVPLRRRSLNPFRELGTLLRLRRLLVRERIDIVHGFTLKCAIYGSLAGRAAGTPARVNAVAGLGYAFSGASFATKLLRPVVVVLLRAAMAGANVRLVVQNAEDATLLARRGIGAAGKVRLVPGSGVDCAAFRPPPAERSGSPMTVLLAARLLWQKGVREYVDVARRLSGTGAAIRFLLAGTPDPGNPNSVGDAALSGWVHEGVVEWLGQVEDMASLMREVDVVALPSYYGEGLPKSLIEAAASGCALIATDMPGCRDVVEDEVTGLLVAPRDPATLSAAVLRLHDDPALRRRLGRAARRKALTEFDERRIIEQTVAVYRELIPSGDRSAAERASAPTTLSAEPHRDA